MWKLGKAGAAPRCAAAGIWLDFLKYLFTLHLHNRNCNVLLMDVLHVDMQDVPHQVCHFLMPLLNQVNNTMSPQNEYASTT